MAASIVSKHKRITAGILVMLMLFVMLFSAFFIAAEAGHDCTGEDCPVCACIQQCVNTLRRTGEVPVLFAAVIIPVVFMLAPAVLFDYGVTLKTLVSGKVRMNN